MSIHVAILHHTRYTYEHPVALSPQVVRLRPAAHCRTPILSYSLKIEPSAHFLNWQQDPFGNYLARIVFPERVSHFDVRVEVIADLTTINPFDFFLEKDAETVPFSYNDHTLRDLAPYLVRSDDSPLLRDFLTSLPPPSNCGSVNWLVALNLAVHRAISYTIRMEPGVQSCNETLTKRSGSCRDSAWLLVQCLRAFGYAARFVSGYLVQLAPDQKPIEGPAGPSTDFTDLHAWTEIYIPGAGWVGLDPTSGLFAGEGHIPLACTPDPRGAAPIEGASEICKTTFLFENKVSRIHEDPRVSKPYSESDWACILALGNIVDDHLRDGDVRLTIGGEPTFVSIDDMEAPEWNTTADSPSKRSLGHALLRRLHHRFGDGGILHIGEGKWYPGEPLPRWAYTCLWRKDRLPIWRNPSLFADPTSPGLFSSVDAQRFLAALARRLEVFPEHLLPAHEDIAYYLWRESTLPLHLDPSDKRLLSSLERKHLASLLDQGLGTPTAFVLPIHWHPLHNRWVSCSWELRRHHLFLVPGNSPAGLRLPLDSIPWTPPVERAFTPEPSPLEPLSPFPSPSSHLPPRPPILSRDITHTALATEIRDGRLHVFLPPLPRPEELLDLLAAIEDTASSLNFPIILEGYLATHDPRFDHIKVTPDPGVIEVNLHPSASWADLVSKTETLYHEARQARLGTEKFMIDGRHTGTGGGNHVTLGGFTPSDSPFLRRPGLLRSLLTYWQHHPSLSYLFSGMFIGPTSQAPRLDEARNDRLYELEIAFSQLPTSDNPPPWLVDRILRNHLTDLTGNTHRSEFSIDKLYSPDGPAGRLGLLELRAFEMPPHPRMSLLQQLLVRALVAAFWHTPYHKPLIPWGTSLHDKFMLPHFNRRDIEQVVSDLQGWGFPFQSRWFDPFWEFRFPRLGSTSLGDIHLELRFAIEPWHVLGEESSSSGTSRYVDSSAERLQVRLRGITPERHGLTVNGRRIPLVATGTHGEFVAGVRYQAWQPWSALHPTLPPQTPLVFDVLDLFNGRSIGGCIYHVSHPGGRSYDIPPVNALEAEARRVTRFWQEGHTPDSIQPHPVYPTSRTDSFLPTPGGLPASLHEEDPDPEFPCTFDLRRPKPPLSPSFGYSL